MALEVRFNEIPQSTLSWDDIDSVCESMQQWLERNRTAASNSHYSILWWEVLTKVKYHFHGSKMAEMFSEIAKAIVKRGEKLKICEMADTPHRMYIDLDIKMRSGNPSEQTILTCLLPVIQEFIQQHVIDQRPYSGIVLHTLSFPIRLTFNRTC